MNNDAQLARYARIITAAVAMSDIEKNELAAWERVHVTGDGQRSTSDWPAGPRLSIASLTDRKL